MYDIEISDFTYNEIEESRDYVTSKHGLGFEFQRDVFAAINNYSFISTLYPIILI